jgi:hypothetical protein
MNIRKSDPSSLSQTSAAASTYVSSLLKVMTAAVLCLSMLVFAAAPAFAAEDNGADAHARSMSMGTGEEPITDEATTLDYGQSDDAAGAEEQLIDDSGDEDDLISDEESDETDAEDAEDASDITEPDDLSGKATTFLIAAAVIAAAALAAVLIIRSMKKRL